MTYRTPSRNDDPPDEDDVYEFKRGEMWFAYTLDDEVFAYLPDEADRDDGYVLIGSYTPTEENYEAELFKMADDWFNNRGSK